MIWVKVNGIWMQSTPFIKNQWRQATGYNLTNNFGIPEIYSGPNTESLRSSLYSLQIFNQETYQDSYVYSSTAKFGANGASGARAAFYYEQATGKYKNRLWYRNDKPVISYTTFGASSLSKVKISKIGSSVTGVDIKPRSKDFNPIIINGSLEMQMLPKEKAWVTINGDVSNTLFVFCDPYKPEIPIENCLYFEPGVHHLSALDGAVEITATSGARSEVFKGASYSALDQYGYVRGTPFTIYLDGGAYVIGQFDLRKKHNIKVIGPGILAGDNVVEQCTRFEDDPFNTAMEPYGILSQLRGVTYSYQEQGLNTYDEAPSGLVVSGPTIVNCHFLTMPGINVIDNVKVLSPFMTNVDIKAPMPDNSTSAAIMRDSLFFMGDDAIVPTPYNAYATNPNTGYLNVGGRFDISGCQVYTTNGGPLVLSYFGVLYPSTTPNAFPLNVYNMDFGVYTYNEGGGGKNNIPINSEHGEAAIRVTLDMSSIFSGAWANGVPKYGINNVTVSNIKFDDPIDQALLWVGNVPDPYFPTPLPFRGDEHGSMSGITFKNIAVISHTGFASSLYSNLLFSKNNTNRPKNVLFQDIKLDGVNITNANYRNYFVLSGIAQDAPDLLVDNISFDSDIFTINGGVPELYAPTGAGIESISSTRYLVDVYNVNQFSSAFTFGRSRVAIAAYGATGAEPAPRNKLWTSGTSPELSFLTFGASSQTTVRISKKNESITSLQLKPASKNYEYTVSAGKAYIKMAPNDKVWATINNEVSSPLFIFCDNYKDPVPAEDQPHIYFSAGIHHVSALLPATGTHTGRSFETTANTFTTIRGLGFSSFEEYGYEEGQPFTVYLDGGAYVIGSFDLRTRHNITFKGPGVLSLQNFPKETMNTLKDAVSNPFPAGRDIGAIPIRHGVGYDEYTSIGDFDDLGDIEYPDLKKIASGIVIKDITIIDTPFYNIQGANTVNGVKILSPWSPNTDAIFTIPDPQSKNAYVINCFVLNADDCFLLPTNDAGSKYFDDYVTLNAAALNANNIFPAPGFTIGGSTTVSGCQLYSVNNGIIATYGARYNYNDPPTGFAFGTSYPIKIHNCDFGKFVVQKGDREPVIRLTTDLSSSPTNPSVWAFANIPYTNWGIRNVTISSINIEDTIDESLFWIGNIPDPFNDPNEPTIGDIGNEFGYLSGIVLKNINVSGSSYNTEYIYNNRIWGRDASSTASYITLSNIKINGTYLNNTNKDSYITWASGANPTYTDPDTYGSNIVVSSR